MKLRSPRKENSSKAVAQNTRWNSSSGSRDIFGWIQSSDTTIRLFSLPLPYRRWRDRRRRRAEQNEFLQLLPRYIAAKGVCSFPLIIRLCLIARAVIYYPHIIGQEVHTEPESMVSKLQNPVSRYLRIPLTQVHVPVLLISS